MNLAAIAMGPVRFVRLALIDHYHRHKCWPQRVVLHTGAFHSFMLDLDANDTGDYPNTIRRDGSVLLLDVPVYPSVRTHVPYLIDYKGKPYEL